MEDSHYALGPRVILLDHYIRKADPVLREGTPVMRELVAATGFDCVSSGMFGMQCLGNPPPGQPYDAATAQ